MEQKKTVIEWLDTLPQPQKTKAYLNTSLKMERVEASSLSEALTKAFDWSKTAEGATYWTKVHRLIGLSLWHNN